MADNHDASKKHNCTPTNVPQPTVQDYENERVRREIAARQEAEYTACLTWATKVFGPGWHPSHKHFLIDKAEEARVRFTSEKPKAAATVFTVKNAIGEKRHFTVQHGEVQECESYEQGFGSMLHEPHPTMTIEVGGKTVHPHRYSLCFAPFELYYPKSAEQLAASRAIREKNKKERDDKKWAEEHLLFAWAGYRPEDFEGD